MAARVDFNVPDFEQLILDKGYNLSWEQAVMCPCVDPVTHHSAQTCPQCDGRGKFYFNAQTIKGVITRQNKELQIGDAIGVLEPGNAYLTVPAKYKLSWNDRIINLDSLTVYHEVVIHDDQEGDWLRYVPINGVEFMCTQATRNSNITELKDGIDFTVATDGKITYITNKAPAHNQALSVRYYHHPVWLVTDIPNYVRDTFVQQGNVTDTATAMPLRVQIKLEHLGSSQK